MGAWKLQLAAILCCFNLSVIAQSDMIPDPVNFEFIPPDREELLEHFQLVLRALDALSVKVDRRVGDLDVKVSSKLRVVEETLSGLDSKIETINAKLQPLESMSHSTEIIRSETEEALQKILAIENVVVHTGSVVGNVSLGVDLLKDQLELMTTNATTLEGGMGEIIDESSVRVKSEREQMIDSLLGGKKGLLYTGKDLTGSSHAYDFDNSGDYKGCVKLVPFTWDSVDTFNSCIRLFTDNECHGYSLAVYPGSDSAHNFRSKLSSPTSIGPCFSNEFDFSSLSNSTAGIVATKNFSNPEEIPNSVHLGGYHAYNDNSTKIHSSSNPVTAYLMDSRYRIQYFVADIFPRHLNSTPVDVSRMESSPVWRALDKKEGDDLGFIIPLEMGGPGGSEAYNVFPQSRENARGWAGVMNEILAAFLEDNINYSSRANKINVFVNMAYPNRSTNRPHGFYYIVEVYRSNERNEYKFGFMRN